jgi:23S rRNA (uracil1939-C5)-methyltransferase
VLPAIRDIGADAVATAGRARLVVTLCHNGVDLSVNLDRAPAPKGRGRRKSAAPPPLMTADERIVRLSVDGETVLQREAPVVRFDGVDVPFPPATFLQASLEGESALQELVLGAAKGAEVALDAFCGLGTFAIPLTRFARVTAVEVDGDALAALSAGHARASGRKAVASLKRDLMRHPLGPEELRGYDVAVFDPPRAGAEGLARSLAAAAIPRIVAVSCEPVTLARDCAILAEAGYTITQATPVDQFVGTDHIEVVAILERTE